MTITTEAMLTAAIEALATHGCPFESGAILHDETHVDIFDAECYLRTDPVGCLACVREALEERVVAAGA